MTELNVLLLATQGTPASFIENAGHRMDKLLPSGNYKFTESSPDVLFFLTGGTEQMAINLVSEGRFYMLVGSQNDNAYASATEVKAYLNERNIPSILLGEEDDKTKVFLQEVLESKKAINALLGKKLGLIGKVSDWLISSSISPDLLKSKLGVELIRIPWEELAHFSEFKPADSFLSYFSGTTQMDLSDTAKVSGLLTETIERMELDAITVECFPLVKKDSVTACLPLAKLNNDGFPAGCEGDITAIVGMMLCKELTGIVPWIANINKANEESCLFSHCTIAPKLVSRYSIKTHFETGLGTAIEGDFLDDQVTIFRFDHNLSRAFIASANITGRPKSENACRTQIEVKLREEEVKLLRQSPLGNHHLIIPGDHTKVLKLACLLLGMEIQGVI